MRRQPWWRRPLALFTAAALLTGLALSFPAPVMAAGPVITAVLEESRTGSTVGGTTIHIIGINLGDVREVLVDGVPASSVVARADLVTAVTPPAKVARRVAVTVVDSLNNRHTLPSTSPDTFEYLLSAPSVTRIDPSYGSTFGGEVLTVLGQEFHPEASVFFGADTPAQSIEWVSTEKLLVTAPSRGSVGQVPLRIVNPDGGEHATSQKYEYANVPRIEVVTPSWGPTSGGTKVTIMGSNFPANPNASQVRFGGQAVASVDEATSEKLVVTTPPGDSCVELQIDAGSFTGKKANSFCYRVTTPTPVISHLTPSQGSLLGGDEVVIHGTDFIDGASVTFGTKPATVEVVTPTSITVKTPAHNEGDVRVTVTNPGIGDSPSRAGYLEHAFRYALPENMLIVTSVTPNEGPVGGGTKALIHGENLKRSQDYTVTVTFGGIPAMDIEDVEENGKLVAYRVRVPAGGSLDGTFPQAVDVAVLAEKDGFRSERAVLRAGYSYTLSPSNPRLGAVEQSDYPGYNRGPAASSFRVTLQGSDFRAPAKVWFNDQMATDVVVHEGGEVITAVTPVMGQPTVAHVRVENVDGASHTLYAGFFFDGNSMQLFSVAPTSGSTLGGTTLTLIGANLDLDLMPDNEPADRHRYSTVNIGGQSAEIVEMTPGVPGTPSRIVVKTPTNTAGVKDVTVSNRYGQTSLRNAFTYFIETSQPRIDQLCIWDTATANECTDGDVEGPSTGGTWVVVNGAQLYTGVQVAFGGAPAAEVRQLSDRQLLVRTGKMPPGDLDVTVTNRDGGKFTKSGVYKSISTPKVLGATPAIVDKGGGTIVTLLGEEFMPGIAITVSSSVEPVTDIRLIDGQRVRFRVPETAPDRLTVAITNQDGGTAQGEVLTSVESLRNTAITSVVPNTGTYLGGEEIWIEGTDFAPTGQIAVWFGLEPATVRESDGNRLIVVTPPLPDDMNPPQTIPVTVVNLDDGSTVVEQDGFKYVLTTTTPVLTRATPPIGRKEGGDTVVLRGSGFVGRPTVHFGSAEVKQEDMVDVRTDAIIMKTPASARLGPVDILVTNQDGARARLRGGYTYLDPDSNPQITDIEPNFGTTAGGTNVRIIGSDFRAPVQVYFNGDPATSVIVERGQDGNPDTIRLKTPPGKEGPARVTVVNYDGAAVTVSGADDEPGFRYVVTSSNPKIDAVKPSIGPISGGTIATIEGQDFRGDPRDKDTWPVVYIGDNQAEVVQLVDYAQLKVEIPPGALGPASVTVTNRDGGTVTKLNVFTYGHVPSTMRLTAVVPGEGPAAGGNWVSLAGVDFDPGARVFVDGTEVPRTVENPDDPNGPAIQQIVVSADGKRIDVIMPPAKQQGVVHVLGPVDVEVRNPNGATATLPNGYNYKHPDSKPTVLGADPRTVSSRGGDFIIVTGTDFREGIKVYFATVPAASVTRLDDRTLRVGTPAHAAGQVRLTVLNEDGGTASLGDPIVFKDPGSNPEITKLTPAEGHVDGGTVVIVEGKDFRHSDTEPIEVWLGATKANVTFEAYNRLRVVTPPAADPKGGTVDVTVINRRDGDVASFTLKNAFRYTTERPPEPPTGNINDLVARTISDRVILLTWTGLTGAQHYEIEARTTGTNDPWLPAGQAKAEQSTAMAWYVTGLKPDTGYQFRVRAVNALGKSQDSNTASARTAKTGAAQFPRQEAQATVVGGAASMILESRDALYKMAGYIPLGVPPYDRYARKELKLGSALVNDFAYVTVDFGDLGLVLPTWAMRFETLRNRSQQPFTDAYARLVAQRLEGQAAEAALRTLPAGYRALSPVYDFALGAQVGRADTAATAWLMPVQLSVPLPAAHWDTPAAKLAILRYDPAKRAWESVPKSVWYRQVSAELTLAGRYVLVEVP